VTRTPSTPSRADEHYFTERPRSPRRETEFQIELRGHLFRFLTDAGVFSHARLDRGTELLIQAMEIADSDAVLDLGCGYGSIGIVAAMLAPKGQVYLVDPNARAVELAKRNLERNEVDNASVLHGPGYQPVSDLGFDVIITNPPIRAGNRVVFELIEQSAQHLQPDGHFYLVARTRQGADTLEKKIRQYFAQVLIVKRGGGYRVFRAKNPLRETS